MYDIKLAGVLELYMLTYRNDHTDSITSVKK